MPLRKRGAATTKNQCEKSSARTRCWRPSLPSRNVPGDFLDASRPVWLRETTRRASAIPGGEVMDSQPWGGRATEHPPGRSSNVAADDPHRAAAADRIQARRLAEKRLPFRRGSRPGSVAPALLADSSG